MTHLCSVSPSIYVVPHKVTNKKSISDRSIKLVRIGLGIWTKRGEEGWDGTG